jgi:hypothetical protein
MLNYLNKTYKVGDFVSVFSHNHINKPMICIIKGIYQLSEEIETIPIVELQLCLRKEDFKSMPSIQNIMSERELFPTNRRVCQYITTIREKMT